MASDGLSGPKMYHYCWHDMLLLKESKLEYIDLMTPIVRGHRPFLRTIKP